MIVEYSRIFGMINTIVFQLAERISRFSKSSEAVLRENEDMSGFTYPALPTRHPVPIEPHLHEKS